MSNPGVCSSKRTPRTSASSTSEHHRRTSAMPDEGQQTLDNPTEPIEIQEEMERSFLDYAMSVITARALPDVRDGLKPVQRRVLYGMYELGLRHDSAYKKSARIVGDVLGKYHPLVDGQGNFGSIDGDNAAAMRYTEVRLTELAEELLSDLEKNTVQFVDNFD